MKKKLGLATLLGLLLLMICPMMVSAAAKQDDSIPTYANGRWGRKTVDGVKQKYCRDSDRKLIKGWATIGNHTYYFDSEGIMKTGLIKIKTEYYYFEPKSLSGQMVVGFKNIDGKKYYFDRQSGAAKIRQFTVGKRTFYARTNGSLLVNVWRKTGGKYHYYDSKGIQRDGWFTVGGKKYYCHPKRGKLSGWKTVKKKVYYFTSLGYVATNQWINKTSGGVAQKWFVDDTGEVVRKISRTTQTYEDYGQILMIGDSRFWRTNAYYGITADNVKYCSMAGVGLSWLREEGMIKIIDEVKKFNASSEGKKTALVFNFGVNDLTAYKRYLNYMNGYVSNFARTNNCDLYYVSVNPVDETKFSKGGKNAKTKSMKKIYTFNKQLKNGLNSSFTYINTCSYLEKRYTYKNLTIWDGVHYEAEVSQVVFNRIMMYLRPKQ